MDEEEQKQYQIRPLPSTRTRAAVQKISIVCSILDRFSWSKNVERGKIPNAGDLRTRLCAKYCIWKDIDSFSLTVRVLGGG
jgi:hypothetical protein